MELRSWSAAALQIWWAGRRHAHCSTNYRPPGKAQLPWAPSRSYRSSQPVVPFGYRCLPPVLCKERKVGVITSDGLNVRQFWLELKRRPSSLVMSIHSFLALLADHFVFLLANHLSYQHQHWRSAKRHLLSTPILTFSSSFNIVNLPKSVTAKVSSKEAFTNRLVSVCLCTWTLFSQSTQTISQWSTRRRQSWTFAVGNVWQLQTAALRLHLSTKRKKDKLEPI